MNGSENGYAGALFLALISVGAFFKLDGEIGWAVGIACGLTAAICLRRALIQSAQAAEEDIQRTEIQFQQLRTKVGEISSANFAAMTSFSDAAQVIQENLPVIRLRLAELDNLTQLNKNSETINSTLVKLEKISATIIEELKQLNALEEANKANLLTVLKLVQFIGQMLKNPAYAEDLQQIVSTLETLKEKIPAEVPKILPEENPAPEGLADGNRQDLRLRQKIAAKIKRK